LADLAWLVRMPSCWPYEIVPSAVVQSLIVRVDVLPPLLARCRQWGPYQLTPLKATHLRTYFLSILPLIQSHFLHKWE
jgi:hypothetical protein